MANKIIARVALTADDYYNVFWGLETLLYDLDKKFGDSDNEDILKSISENKKSIRETMNRIEKGVKP